MVGWFNSYINNVINRDVKDIEDIKNPEALLNLMKLCALRTATLLEIGSWAKEVQLTAETLKNYLSILD